MEITNKVEGDLASLRITGRLDAATSPNLEQAVNVAVEKGSQRIVFDMRDVSYVSSAGLRAILLAAKKTKAAGGGVAVFGLQPAVEEVFTVSGFGKIIPIVPTDAEARQKLGA
ncbi:MAG: STAS domain-containing protein [Acetobacteraceae bacterium]